MAISTRLTELLKVQHPILSAPNQASEAARYDKARNEGDFDTAAVIAGEGVDMISDIPPAGEVVERMVKEASVLLAGTNRYRVS